MGAVVERELQKREEKDGVMNFFMRRWNDEIERERRGKLQKG